MWSGQGSSPLPRRDEQWRREAEIELLHHHIDHLSDECARLRAQLAALTPPPPGERATG